MGTARGVGRLGADTWSAVKDKQGRRLARAWERFPGSDWANLNINSSALAPGPDGPVSTQRFESLREGATAAFKTYDFPLNAAVCRIFL